MMVAGIKNGEMRRGPSFDQRLVLALDHFESADAAADIDADLFLVLRRHFQAGVFEGELRRRNGELDEAPHLLNFFFLDVTGRIETFDLSRNPAGKRRGIELGNGSDAALSSTDGLPGRLGPDPKRRQQADAGHYNSS